MNHKSHEPFFKINAIASAQVNDNFRAIVHTCDSTQIGFMSLEPGESIGLEEHDEDQVFMIIKGFGTVLCDGQAYGVTEGDLCMVHSEAKHNVTNDAPFQMKLITMYMPPHHPPGTVDLVKPLDSEDEGVV
jgi:mannose-6-phosphate isomerase-like protein (cupin superfamily)